MKLSLFCYPMILLHESFLSQTGGRSRVLSPICVPQVSIMGKTAKAKKDVSPGPLKRSFQQKQKQGSPKSKKASSAASSKAAAASSPASSRASEPTRSQNSLFLTYLKSAMKSKDENHADSAVLLHEHYCKLSLVEKKKLIMDFFRHGGRKNGLSNCVSQHLQINLNIDDKEWSGYCTAKKLMKLHEALGMGCLGV